MALAEQLRHQPWRRARPSAILALSNRSPPRRIPHSGPLEGREARRARVLWAQAVRPQPLAAPERPRGPRRSCPAADSRRGSGAGGRAVRCLPPARAGRRALPAAARPGPALPAAAARRSDGQKGAPIKIKPVPAAALPTLSPPSSEARGPFCREERKCDSHPRASETAKKRGGENRGEEIGKAYFSSSPAVTPGPPCPLLAAPPRRPTPRRAPLPPSRLPAAPGGGKHTHIRAHN